MGGRLLVTSTLVLALTACVRTVAEGEQIFSKDPDRFVWCSDSIDTGGHVGSDELSEAMERAKIEGATLHLYAHKPGVSIRSFELAHVLAKAAELGLRMTTYDELSTRAVGPSLALSFDDAYLDSWTAIRPMLARHHAHVTFFVTYFLGFNDMQRAQLRQLADDGHDIEYHSTSHLDAVQFTAEHGVDAYIATDIVPGLDAMRAAGYPTRTFAYPRGSRSAVTDEALRPYFDHLRAVENTCPH